MSGDEYVFIIIKRRRSRATGWCLLLLLSAALFFSVKTGWLKEALALGPEEFLLAERSLNLSDRCLTPLCGDNIRLALFYLDGQVREELPDCSKGADRLYAPNWSEVKSFSETSFRLEPGELFAFHHYVGGREEPAVTTNSCLDQKDGYHKVGEHYGAATCDLASLMNWVALDSGLDVSVPARHDKDKPLVNIPYWVSVSIWEGDANQNLYIRNNLDVPVKFRFIIGGDILTLSIYELSY